MNDIIKYFIKSLENSSVSIKTRNILLDTPWIQIDNDKVIRKIIFKKDKGLILSNNGQVAEGSWEYLSEAKALLIKNGLEKILLIEKFIDENVLIFKLDGADNQYYTFANENTIPDCNIIQYLHLLRCRKYRIRQIKLLSGLVLLSYLNPDSESILNSKVEFIDKEFNTVFLHSGEYLSIDKKEKYIIQSNIVINIIINSVVIRDDNSTFEIENSYYENIYPAELSQYKLDQLKNKRVTVDGNPVGNVRFTDKTGVIYVIKDSVIDSTYVNITYKIKKGGFIVIEQSNYDSISKGDKVINAGPVNPLPDGRYKIKGVLRKITVLDNVIL
jgi:hypothetical protein